MSADRERRLLTAFVACSTCGERLRVFPYMASNLLNRAKPFQRARLPEDGVVADREGRYLCFRCGHEGHVDM